MGRRCVVCSSAHRNEIDAAIVAGMGYRRVAARFVADGFTEASVRRHARHHLPATLAQAEAAKEASRADSLVEQLQRLHAKTLTILDGAEGEPQTALAAIREARGNLTLLAAMLAQLPQSPQAQVVDTEGAGFRAALYDGWASLVRAMPQTLQTAIVTWLKVQREQRLQARVRAAEAKQHALYPAPEALALDGGALPAALLPSPDGEVKAEPENEDPPPWTHEADDGSWAAYIPPGFVAPDREPEAEPDEGDVDDEEPDPE